MRSSEFETLKRLLSGIFSVETFHVEKYQKDVFFFVNKTKQISVIELHAALLQES